MRGQRGIRFLSMYLLLFYFSTSALGQAQALLSTYDQDSSFYDIAKISENEFWLGGESGVLYKTDTLGNIEKILNNQNSTILKILKYQDFVFLGTDDGHIIRQNLKTGQTQVKYFKELKKRCIYDMKIYSEDQIIICGGAGAISKAQIAIPRGFVATVDLDLNDLDIVYNNIRKFVWSVVKSDSGKLFATCYDGFGSQVIQMKGEKWDKIAKKKGLIHELHIVENELWFSGGKNGNFNKNGIIGKVFDAPSKSYTHQDGAIWGLTINKNDLVAVTNNGKVLSYQTEMHSNHQSNFSTLHTLYDVEPMGASNLLIAGHGKSAFIIKTNKP